MEIYKAKYDYKDDSDALLSFRQDDKFFIIDKTSSGWWGARRLDNNDLGYVPSSYVEVRLYLYFL